MTDKEQQDKDAVVKEIIMALYVGGYDSPENHHEGRKRFHKILYDIRRELIKRTNEQYP
jgi:hypothetical protein